MYKWIFRSPPQKSGFIDVLMDHFVYSYVDTFIYTFICTYAVAIIFGMILGASPFILYFILKKCGCKCCCCSIIIIMTLTTIIVVICIIYSQIKT